MICVSSELCHRLDRDLDLAALLWMGEGTFGGVGGIVDLGALVSPFSAAGSVPSELVGDSLE